VARVRAPAPAAKSRMLLLLAAVQSRHRRRHPGRLGIYLLTTVARTGMEIICEMSGSPAAREAAAWPSVRRTKCVGEVATPGSARESGGRAGGTRPTPIEASLGGFSAFLAAGSPERGGRSIDLGEVGDWPVPASAPCVPVVGPGYRPEPTTIAQLWASAQNRERR